MMRVFSFFSSDEGMECHAHSINRTGIPYIEKMYKR